MICHANIQWNPVSDFFKSFTLVIAADVGEKSLRRLSEILWEGKVPLMAVRSYGFIGYIRLQVGCLNGRHRQVAK